MTTGFIILTIAISLLKVIIASPPTFVVEWLLGKFALHSKLSEESATVTLSGKRLEGEDKTQFIRMFNEATFFDKYNEYNLPASNMGTPFIIDANTGKRRVTLSVYIYSGHADVFKHGKKKTVAYSLRSESLQEC